MDDSQSNRVDGPTHPPGKPPRPSREWREKAAKATDMVLHIERYFHPGESRDEIHRRVIGHAREALAMTPTAEFHKVLDVKTDAGVEAMEMLSCPGVFRLVLDHADFDLADARASETFMAEVQKTLARLA